MHETVIQDLFLEVKPVCQLLRTPERIGTGTMFLSRPMIPVVR